MKKEFVDGLWTGDVVRNADGDIILHCCHYTLAWGRLHFYADCTHDLAGQTIRLPELPNRYTA